MSVPYLADLLDALLDEAAAGVTPDRTGHPLPTRIMRTHGPPAVDLCTDDGLLAVYLDRAPHLHPQSRARMSGRCLVVVTADVVVELWRCHPTMQDNGDPWPATVYDTAAEALAIDLWALLTHLHYAWQAGDLMPGVEKSCQSIAFGTVTPLAPSGGTAGWRVPLTYTLDDPAPTGLAS